MSYDTSWARQQMPLWNALIMWKRTKIGQNGLLFSSFLAFSSFVAFLLVSFAAIAIVLQERAVRRIGHMQVMVEGEGLVRLRWPGGAVSSATILPSIAEVPPIPVASAVPISCSEGNEDIAASPLAKVVSIDVEGNSVPQPSAPPPPSAPTAGEATCIVPTAGESLATCLSEAGSFGRTEAISEWIGENSLLASTLSPEDMALAFSAVTFSLDQPLAAKDISAGVDKAGGAITCDHIVRTLGVCDRSARLEVARGMAPYVSDLEHEETILGLFESSYEREQVDRALNAYSIQSI